MTTIRRIYAYLLAFAGLAMFATAAANLAQLLIDLLVHAPLTGTDRYVRDTASLWGATALVGLPVWLLHWLWIQRTARADARERSSTLRRLYSYAVLAGAMAVISFSVREVLVRLFEALAGAPAPGSTPGSALDLILRPLPFTLVAALVWLAHWRLASADRAQVGETAGSATLRRWYVYGWAFIGLFVLLTGARLLVEVLWQAAVRAAGPSTGLEIADAAADALVGLGIWLVHWIVLPNRLPEPARRDDGTSVLRSVYLFFALAMGVIGTLLGASQLLYYAVARLLGVDQPGGVGGDLLQAAAGPASVVIVNGAAWAYQRQALRRQAAAFDEAPRQAGIRRLYMYVIALVALGVLATGATGLLWTLADVLFAPGAAVGTFWRERVALFATLAIVGLPVWLLNWRPVAASTDEARSLARRLYVYLSLIAAMLSVIGSLAGALYRVLGLALGGAFSTEVATDLAHAVALASVAAVVATYHWRVLRADAKLAEPEAVGAVGAVGAVAAVGAAGSETGALETGTGAPLAGGSTAIIEIRAADADALDRALAALQATGVDVRVLRSAGEASSA